MKFYNRYYESGYEELITYYPRFYRDVYEMREILKAHGRVTDELENNIERTFFNFFILTADLETVEVWERTFGITYDETLTLDQRRHVILGKLGGFGHIGEPEIRAIVRQYTDKGESVDFRNGTVVVTLEELLFGRANLMETLRSRIPAHLALLLAIHFHEIIEESNVEKFKTDALHMKFAITSYGGNVIRLDGEKHLDGSWILQQAFQGVTQWRTQISTAIQEQEKITPQLALGGAGARTENRMEVTAIIPTTLQEKPAGRLKQVSVSVAARQEYSISGTLTKDSMWKLDGTETLGGSRKLNADIVKEEI